MVGVVDSASLELIEKRVMARLSSLMHAHAKYASGERTAGITPTKNPAPAIQSGLLGSIAFNDDGSIDQTSRERIVAVAKLLRELHGNLEIRAITGGGVANVDIAIARARRVYFELLAEDERLIERDVAITVSSTNTIAALPRSVVEIFWRETQ